MRQYPTTRDFTTAPSGSREVFMPSRVWVPGLGMEFRTYCVPDPHQIRVIPRGRETHTKPKKEK